MPESLCANAFFLLEVDVMRTAVLDVLETSTSAFNSANIS